jgi:hypothetical protein
VIQAAIVHAQFETIHPFPDGWEAMDCSTSSTQGATAKGKVKGLASPARLASFYITRIIGHSEIPRNWLTARNASQAKWREPTAAA